MLMDPSVAGEYCQAFTSVSLSGVDACIEDAVGGGVGAGGTWAGSGCECRLPSPRRLLLTHAVPSS